jgi:hypothetical protein
MVGAFSSLQIQSQIVTSNKIEKAAALIGFSSPSEPINFVYNVIYLGHDPSHGWAKTANRRLGRGS